jgi:hypothetical protein
MYEDLSGQTTVWGDFPKSGESDPAAHRAFLEKFLARYMPAIQSYLIRACGVRPQDAEDVMHNFLASKVLEGELLTRANKERGRFRSLLQTSLSNFVTSQKRMEKAAKRDPGTHTASIEDASEPASAELSPPQAFDVAWARELLRQAAERMKALCQQTQRPDIWGVFEARMLAGTLNAATPLEYEALVRLFGFKSPAQASNVLMSGKRMFNRCLRATIAEYEPSDAMIEQEISSLLRILGGET